MSRISAVLTVAGVLCAAGAFAVESMEPGGMQLVEGWRFQPAAETGELAIVNSPESLEKASPAAPGADWPQIELGRSWFEQGFNPQRAGWYRCNFKLPPELLGKVLAVEIRGRRTGEAVYFNGEPVGALSPVPADSRTSYLAPAASTEDATLVLRLDAPDLERPALDSVVVQAAAMLDYMTPVSVPGADGKLRLVHRPVGLDFFTQEPVALGNLRVNAGSTRPGFAYRVGGGGSVSLCAVNVIRFAYYDYAALGTSYQIRDALTGEQVLEGSFVMDVSPAGVRREIEIFDELSGSYILQFTITSRGDTRTFEIPYTVLPEPPRRSKPSPFGIIIKAHNEIARLTNSSWLMQPAVLTTSFIWENATASPPVIARWQADAADSGYRLIGRQLNAPHIRTITLPTATDIKNAANLKGTTDIDAAADYLRENYLRQKSAGDVILQLNVPDEPQALNALKSQGEQYYDILCLMTAAPAPGVFQPVEQIAAKAAELREIAGRSAVPPAIAMVVSTPRGISPSDLVQMYVTAAAQGLHHIIWDSSEPAGYAEWVASDSISASHLLAVSTLNSMLGEAEYLGELQRGENFRVFAFHNGIENVIVAWSTGIPATVVLPPAQRAVSISGRTLQHDYYPEDGAMTLTGTPIYLAGIDTADLEELAAPDPQIHTEADLPNRAKAITQIDPMRAVTATMPDAQILAYKPRTAFRFNVENLGQSTVSGRIMLKAPKGWEVEPEEIDVSLKPAGDGANTSTVEFYLTVPDTETPDTHRLDLVMAPDAQPDGAPDGKANGADAPQAADADGAKPNGAAIVHPDAKPVTRKLASFDVPLVTPIGTLAGMHLTEVQSSAPSLAMPVRNHGPEAVRARVSLSVGDWQISPPTLPVELEPGEEKLLRFIAIGELPPVGPLPVTVKVREGGRTLQFSRTADVSRQRVHGWSIGRPEVQTLRFTGRRLSYSLTKMAVVSIRIYDTAGNMVRIVDAGWQAAGPHSYVYVPEREFDELGNRITYIAEVRAGLDLVFDQRIDPAPDAILEPEAAAVDADEVLHVFEGPRALQFTPYGRLLGAALPAITSTDIFSLRPVNRELYAAIRGQQILLLDANGNVRDTIPQTARRRGSIQPGAFRNPTTLAVSPDGLIYVADTGNHRVQRFDLNLSPSGFPAGNANAIGRIDRYGLPAPGTADGEFTSPMHVAVNRKGQLAVFDLTGRIQLFDATGKHVKTSATPYQDVDAAAIDFDGSVFITRAGSTQVSKIDGNLAGLVNSFGDNGTLVFDSPVTSLAADGHGRLYVCTADTRAVHVYDSRTGAYRGILGTAASARVFGAPGGLDVDRQGSLYITDIHNRRVLKFTSGGSLAWSVPDLRVNLYLPLDTVLHANGLYVLDKTPQGRRVLALDVRGRPQYVFDGSYILYSDELARATAIDVDAAGNFWAGDTERGTVFDAAGTVLRRNVPPPRVYSPEHAKAAVGGFLCSAAPDGGIVISDRNGREILRKGGIGTEKGTFGGSTPGGIATLAGGAGKADTVYYADPVNRSISVLRIEWAVTAQTANTP